MQQLQAAPGAAERVLEGWARALFEGIDDAVFVHDLDGRILEANPAACLRLGYTREEMLRLTTRDIDDPEFAAGFADRLHQQLEGGHLRCEGRHRTKDGRVVPVDINTSRIVIGERPAVLAVMRDITERKRAEDSLHAQTELLESMLANMTDGVVVADERGRFLVFNPEAERLFGSGAGDVSPHEWPARYGLYLPDRVTPFPADQLPLVRAIRGERVEEVEIFVRHERAPRGYWVSVSGGPLRDGGRDRGGVVVCRDITDRKRTEQRIATQYAVTQTLAGAESLEDAAPVLLWTVCEGLGWDAGGLWAVAPSGHYLHNVAFWHRPGLRLDEFAELSRSLHLEPGAGLPGMVWAGGEPVWISDVRPEQALPRTDAAIRAGLLCGRAFPILSGGETVGVLEAFSLAVEQPDDELMSLMASLGSQIGQALERQHITRALRESEAFYHSLVESLPQNIFRKDLEGRVTFGNQRYCATLRRSLDELIGKTDFDLFPAELAAKYREDDCRVQQCGEASELVEEHVLPGGSKIYVQVIKTPIRDEDGRVIGTQGMFWDVTERKVAEEAVAASERRYRQLTEATLDGIVVADHEGRIILFNPAAEALFGYRAAEAVGQPLTLLVPEEYQEAHRRGFARYLATRQARIVGTTVELFGRRKDGASFPLELALSAIELSGGEVQFLGAVRDLTERNRIRQVLVQNEKLASIGLLSAGVAHEINNPLAFVANNLAVLERDNKGLMALLTAYEGLAAKAAGADPEGAAAAAALAEEIDIAYIRESLPRQLSRTRDGVDRVTRIVHSLRGLARTDTPHKQDTNLPDLVENSLDLIRGRLTRRGIAVETDYDANSQLRCVSTQFGQVLLNLLVNALQAIEASGHTEPGLIRVTTRRLADDMLIEVSDNGTGIEPEVKSRLFDPFFTTKDVGEGTGLGLSITHNIVEAHGGRIEVESEPGRGTTFRLFLPLNPPRDSV